MMSRPFPWGIPSMMSMRTTSASSPSARRWARVAPTFPPPTTVTFLFISGTPSAAILPPRPAPSPQVGRACGPGGPPLEWTVQGGTMPYQLVKVPDAGERIAFREGRLRVPDHPIVPFIEGDGTGPDIWRASVRVFDAEVAKAYAGKRRIQWMEVFAGEKSQERFQSWLPDETVEAFREFVVGIKGPLTTPVGGGFRSLNVALRQMLDLYVCLRPVHWYKGVPSPVKHPEKVDMVIFRENTEDIYAGIEFESGSKEAQKVLASPQEASPALYKKIRFPATTALGIKPVSREATQRRVKAAPRYAVANRRHIVTLAHQDNNMKFTEWCFRTCCNATADESV